MDALVRRQIESVHASPTMAVMAIAGGASRALAWLLGVPGASRTVLEAVVPYSPSALEDHLGYAPDTVLGRAQKTLQEYRKACQASGRAERRPRPFKS